MLGMELVRRSDVDELDARIVAALRRLGGLVLTWPVVDECANRSSNPRLKQRLGRVLR